MLTGNYPPDHIFNYKFVAEPVEGGYIVKFVHKGMQGIREGTGAVTYATNAGNCDHSPDRSKAVVMTWEQLTDWFQFVNPVTADC